MTDKKNGREYLGYVLEKLKERITEISLSLVEGQKDQRLRSLKRRQDHSRRSVFHSTIQDYDALRKRKRWDPDHASLCFRRNYGR